MTVTIEAFDATTVGDDALREYYDFMIAIEREREPDDPVEPFDLALLNYRKPPSWERQLRWVARDAGALVGCGFLELEYTESNRHLAWCDVAVRADARRRGVGSLLLDEVIAAARNDDRTVLGVTVSGLEPGGDNDPFVVAKGFEKRLIERRSRLLTAELDRSMLEEWVTRANERAGEYSLIAFDDGCPDELLEAYVGVIDVMNTAPREDLDMEDEHYTAERVREREARERTRRMHRLTLLARHDPSGELAGFTEIESADWMGDLAWQDGTAVDPKHRDKGLGRLLKATMALRLLDEFPHVARVDTWNAGSNRPMLGINIAMGFKPVRYYGDWQRAI